MGGMAKTSTRDAMAKVPQSHSTGLTATDSFRRNMNALVASPMLSGHLQHTNKVCALKTGVLWSLT